jgi:RNA-directed DNA polymerase
MNFDIINFFPSIKLENIEKIFKDLGYSDLISNLLAKLCTRNKELPQGAPTSPYLSNIFFKPIDDIIANFCIPKKIRYTRFADDLTFSGDFEEEELKTFIIETLLNFNLPINPDKTKTLRRNQRQIVTGVVVNDKMQVPFYKRNKIRQTMFFINKFGILSHKEKLKVKNKNYISHLLGKINFILQMNPEDKEFLNYKKELIEIKKKNPFC